MRTTTRRAPRRLLARAVVAALVALPGAAALTLSLQAASASAGTVSEFAGTGSTTANGQPLANLHLSAARAAVSDAAGDTAITDGTNVYFSPAASGTYFNIAMTAGDVYTVATTSLDSTTLFDAIAFDSRGDLLLDGENGIVLVAVTACSSSCPYGLGTFSAGVGIMFAGGGTSPEANGTPASNVQASALYSLAVDQSGNAYFVDENTGNALMVADSSCSSSCPLGLPSTTAGDLYIVAGTGTSGTSGDPALGGSAVATTAGLKKPTTVALSPSGGLDIGLNPGTPSLPSVAFVANATCSSNCPFGLASTTPGDLYWVAGDGTAAPTSGGPATGVSVAATVLASDWLGNIYVEQGFYVFEVAAASCSSSCPFGLASTTAGDIYSIAGNGTFGQYGETNGGSAAGEPLGNAFALAFSPFDATTAPSVYGLVLSQGASADIVAGTSCASSCPLGLGTMTAGDFYLGPGTWVGDGGAASSSALNAPTDVAADAAGDVAIVDSGEDTVRFTPKASGTYFGQSMNAGDIYTVAGITGESGTSGQGNGQPAASAELTGPYGVAIDSAGNIFFSEADYLVMVANASCASACPFGLPSTVAGDMYYVAGNGSYPSGALTTASSATGQPVNPSGIAVDALGDVFVFDNGQVAVVAAANGDEAGSFGLSSTSAGDLYVVAGSGTVGSSGVTSGTPATNANLGGGRNWVALDPSGNLYLTDASASQIDVVAAASCSSSCPFGWASVTAADIYPVLGTGTAGTTNETNGAAITSVQLNEPAGLAVDSYGDVIVASDLGDALLMAANQTCASACPLAVASTTLGELAVIDGLSGGDALSGDGGPVSSAGFYHLAGIALDGNNNLYVAEQPDNRIRVVANSTAPMITSASSTTCTVGSSCTFTFTASGSPAPTITETGTLPSGVSFTGGTSSASLSGTPAAGSSGTYVVTITASNGVNPAATQSFTLTVSAAPTITSASSTTCTVGSSCAFTFTASGSPAPTITETGTLPSGVSFAGGTGSASLSGTPAAGSTGSYALTITASNGVNPAATQTFTLTVSAAPTITSASSTTCTVGSSCAFTFTATGTPTPTLAESGSLPSGVSFTGGTGSASLSGTPAAGSAGSYPVTITASNGVNPAATQSFTLTVSAAAAQNDYVSTVAGNGTAGYSGEGLLATSSSLSYPTDAAVDGAGDLFVADMNRVRFVPKVSGTYFGQSMTAGDMYTILGTGTSGATGETSGTLGTSAEVNFIHVGVDPAGNLVAADANNNDIMIVAVQSCSSNCPFGFASMTAGDLYRLGAYVYNPQSVAVDQFGNVFVTSPNTHDVDMYPEYACSSACPFGLASTAAGTNYVVAGTGSSGSALPPDGSLATNDNLDQPAAVAVDSTGNVYVADVGLGAVEMVAAYACSSGCPLGLSSTGADGIYVIAGTGTTGTSGQSNGTPATSAEFSYLQGITVDSSGDVFVADEGPNNVLMVADSTCSSDCPLGFATTAGALYIVAGTSSSGAGADGVAATNSALGSPWGLATDTSGNVYVVDTGNYRVQLVANASQISPVITSPSSMTCDTNVACSAVFSASGAPAPSISVTGGLPAGVAASSGTGAAFALGTPTQAGTYALTVTASNGVGTNATQNFTLNVITPVAPAITSGATVDCTVNTSCPFTFTATGTPTPTITESGSLPSGETFTGGAGTGTADLSGTPTTTGTYSLVLTATNGVNPAATQDVTLAVTPPNDYVTTFAGTGTAGYTSDGVAAPTSELNAPGSVAVDGAGNVFIADMTNRRVRFVPKTSGTYFGQSMVAGDIYTILGTGTSGSTGETSGTLGTTAEVNWIDVATDPAGNLVAADANNNDIMLVAAQNCSSNCPFGLSSMTAGDLYRLGAFVYNPAAITVDSSGDVFVTSPNTGTVDMYPEYPCSSACPFGLSSTTAGTDYTIAGTGASGSTVPANGTPALSVTLDQPAALATDASGNVYLGDGSLGVVEMFAARDCSSQCPFGLTSTYAGGTYVVAGTGTAGTSGQSNGTPATSAEFTSIAGLAIDSSGNLYISDQASTSNRVFMVAAAACSSGCRFGIPTTADDLYVVAGNGSTGGPDNVVATSSGLEPAGLATDGAGDLYASDDISNWVQEISQTTPLAPSVTSGPSTTCTEGFACQFVFTAAGAPPASVSLSGSLPSGLSTTSGTEQATLSGTPASTGSYTLTVSATNGISPAASQSFTLTVLAPSAPSFTSASSTSCANLSACSFAFSAVGDPSPTITESGSLPPGVSFESYGDSGGAALVGSSTQAGTWSLVVTAANGVSPAATQTFTLTTTYATPPAWDISTFVGNGNYGESGDGGPATTATIYPQASSSGILGTYFATGGDVRFVPWASGTYYGIAMQGGYIYTIAGGGATTPANGVVGTSANFSSESGIAVDSSGNVYFTINNEVWMLAGAACSSSCPLGVPPTTSGDIYIVAGTGTGGYSGDTTAGTAATTAQLDGSDFLALDSSGNLYVSTSVNVVMVANASCTSSCPFGLSALTPGYLYLLAGNGSASYGGNPASGTAGPSTDLSPSGIAVDAAGNVYFANVNGGEIFEIAAQACSSGCPYGVATPSADALYPVLGNDSNSGSSGDSPTGTSASSFGLYYPNGLAIDAAGNLYVAGYMNNNVAMLAATTCSSSCPLGLPSTTAGDAYVVAGDGTLGSTGDGGPATAAELHYPWSVSVDAQGRLYIDTLGQRVRLVSPPATTITSAASATCTVGSPCNVAFAGFGAPAPSFAESGALPSGVIFTGNLYGGTLSGTPAAGSGGTYTLTLSAGNGVYAPATQSFTLTVQEPPSFTSANTTTCAPSVACSFTVTATGSPSPTITESGTLPSGMSFTGGTGTASISGTPAAGSGGTYSLVLTATNGISPAATQSFTLTVGQPPAITSASSTACTAGSSCSFTFTATGSPSPTITESGTLPSGVSFSGGAGTGQATLSGTPAAGGTFALTITADNGISPAATQSFTLSVSGTLTISAPSTVSFSPTLNALDSAYGQSFPLTASDTTGSGSGWNVSAQLSTPLSVGTTTFPVVLNGSSASPSATTAPSVTCNGTCTPATNAGTTWPVTLSTSQQTVASAQSGSGEGSMNLGDEMWITVPGNAQTGSGSTTLTLTISSGP